MDQSHLLMYERLRLLSFDKRWKKFKSQLLSPENFAKAGFVFKGPPDRVQCVFCLITLEKWEESDDPEKEHEKYAPNCNNWNRKLNISIEEENFDNNVLREYEERLKTFEVQFTNQFSFHRALFLIKNASFFAKNGFFLHKNGYLQCVDCKIIVEDCVKQKIYHNSFCSYKNRKHPFWFQDREGEGQGEGQSEGEGEGGGECDLLVKKVIIIPGGVPGRRQGSACSLL